MKRAVIVSGGSIHRDFALAFLEKNKKENSCLIAADRGLEFFQDTGLVPDIAVGDFDSLSLRGKQYLDQLTETEIIKLKPEKDDSDTQSAACLAMDRGAKEILIFGATGKRVDHLLANFGLLVLGKKRGAEITLVDPWNCMKIIASGTVLKRREQFGTYVSFFSLEGEVSGLTLKGFRYPLNRHCLRAEDSGLTVSNEITEEEAMVEYDSGTLLMLMTRD